jgi:hypothetical protein
MAETASRGQIDEAAPKRRTISAEQAMRRRVLNRDCMRRKRQDPAYRAFERRRREWRDLEPGQDRFFEGAASAPIVGRKSKQRCSICRQREAVEIITRLRPCAEVRGGYVQMRIAYCGLC